MSLSETTSSTSPLSAATVTTPLAKTFGYYAAFIALGLVTASLGPTIPGLAEQTGTQLSQVSFLFTTRSLGYLLGALLGGRLYDRLPGHPIMAIMLFGIVITMTLVPFIPVLIIMMLVLLILGIAEGTLDVGGNTLLVWVHRHNVGPYMNALHFFFSIGTLLSLLIIAQILPVSQGVGWVYWTLALLVAPIAVWLLFLSSPPIVRSGDHADQRGETNYTLVVLVALFFFLCVGAEVSAGGWLFTYTTTLNIAPEKTAAYLTSAFWGGLVLGRLLSIPIATRLRPRFILLIDIIGCLLSVGVILIWPTSIWSIWAGAFGLGLFMASIFPTTLSLAERRMAITGNITGWFFVGASAGGMTIPWVVGQLFERIAPIVVMWAILISMSAALAVFFVMIKLFKAK
jgi:MFS transporter, FHS family, Na+ dependent glucose transporter 1